MICVSCSFIFVLFMLLVFYACFYFVHTFFHALLTVKNIAEKVNSKLLQKTRVHIAKISRTRFDRKIKELKVREVIYMALGEIHKYLNEIK